MILLATYLVIGIVTCCVVAARGNNTKRGSLWLGSLIFDPIFPLIIFWPVFVAIALIDLSHPEAEKSQPSIARDLTGSKGVVICPLRPLGKIRVGEQVLEARSNGVIIPEGAQVKLVERAMCEWLVEEVPSNTQELMSKPTWPS